jgi:hypothetical protein
MYHDLPRAARLWSVLLAIDQDLAETTRKKACPCGGRLHSANYLRKPRGTPLQLPEPQRLRLSFCCDRDGCRKRVTPPSVRFLGPKVYLGVFVILISAMRQGPTPSAPTDGPSLAGRSSGANTFRKYRSGRSHAPISFRLSQSSACHIRWWTPSFSAIASAGVGRSCCGFSHRLRFPEPCESRSRDDRSRPAEDARRSLFWAGV